MQLAPGQRADRGQRKEVGEELTQEDKARGPDEAAPRQGPARVDSAKKLTDMLEKVVRLEREAFGIDGNKSGKDTFEEMLRGLGQQ